MLVKKNVLNEINKEGTFTQGFKECKKIKRKVSQNLDDLQNLLIKLTVKASSEKAWLLYEFPFSLNPGGKPNDVLAWKNCSSLYPVSTEDQFQADPKKKWWNILEAAKESLPPNSYLLARKIVSMKALYEERSSKTYIYYTYI